MVNISEYFISQQTHLYVLQSHSMGSWSQTIHCTAAGTAPDSGYRSCACAVPDPDLEIRGRGGGGRGRGGGDAVIQTLR